MLTRIVNFAEDSSSATSAAAELLNQGEVVALPTETVYGLAGDATNVTAVAKIFAAKNRPEFDPLIVHLPSIEALPDFAQVHDEVRELVHELIQRFWPGPLTMILPRTKRIPDLVTSGMPTVAVRLSAHPAFRAIISEFGKPLAAPSANRFGRISPTTASHVLEELSGKIPLVVDGGPTTHGVESTIVMPVAEGLRILRHGPIAPEAFPFTTLLQTPSESGRPVAPGTLASHYCPGTPLILSETGQPVPGKRCGLLAWEGKRAGEFEEVCWLSRPLDLTEAAANLFGAMRTLDSKSLDVIVAEHVPANGIGLAILDRLKRASQRMP